MGAFTREQGEILHGMVQANLGLIGNLYEVVDSALKHSAALRKLLLAKGMITEEELGQAIKEKEALGTLVSVIRPELEALRDEFARLLRGEGEDQSNQRQGE